MWIYRVFNIVREYQRVVWGGAKEIGENGTLRVRECVWMGEVRVSVCENKERWQQLEFG